MILTPVEENLLEAMAQSYAYRSSAPDAVNAGDLIRRLRAASETERSQQFRTRRMSDGHLSIIMDPGTDDCICPPGLAGTDLACRAHEENRL